VAVDDIKKFIAEQDLIKSTRYKPRIRHNYSDKKIAIIGSGPAGLACAYDLAVDGYDVTVFEKEDKLGGMLMLGIPAYRLEKEVLEAEIDIIRELGVKFVTGVEVGRHTTLQDLRKQGFHAFFLAVGAGLGRRLSLPGDEAEGVLSGIEFLRRINSGEQVGVKGKVVVIGGGNVALDAARSAVRLQGVTETELYCLETRSKMPAHKEEVEAAVYEGVKIHNSWAPARIIVRDDAVVGMLFKQCTATHDEAGRFNPKYDEAKTLMVECNQVVVCIGQAYNYATLLQGESVATTESQAIAVHPVTLQSTRPDIFAGGDVVSGPSYAIDAIAAGKEAAVSIHRFVHQGQSLVFGRDMSDYTRLDKGNVAAISDYDGTERQRAREVDHQLAKVTFKDTRGLLTEEQIKKETSRCLDCGASKVDHYLCVGCGACHIKCKFDAIKLERVHDVKGYKIEKLPRTVLKNAVIRKAKIVLRKVFAPSGRR